jgi:hypothetical protein
MPRPPKRLSKQDISEIEMLAGLGLAQEQIADIKGICVETLVKYAGKAYQVGKAKAIARVSKTAFEMAASGKQPSMTMFYLKTQAGWREKVTIPEELLKLLRQAEEK